jgi:hypothetical protein
MSYLLAFRNPTGGGLLLIQNDDESVMEFDSEKAAEELAQDHPLGRAWCYEILEVNI